jgi:four helix bundle protein
MQDFRELKVWQKSHALALNVYRATQRVRRSDFPGIVPQLRRSAASIPANIAEGCGHMARREFARFLQIAIASAFELEYHLILAAELGIISRSTFIELESQTKEVKRMLAGLIGRVRLEDSPRSTRRSDGSLKTDD